MRGDSLALKPKIEDLLRNAFGGMEQGPKPLKTALAFYAKQSGFPLGDFERFLGTAAAAGPNEPVRILFNDQLKRWDWVFGHFSL